MISLVARALLGPVLVVAAALLVRGQAEGGGGFAAGVTAGLGVLLQYVALGFAEAERRVPRVLRSFRVALAGLALTALVAFLPLAAGEPPVSHRPGPGARMIALGPLELHSALVFELGLALATFGFVVAAVRRITASDVGGRHERPLGGSPDAPRDDGGAE